MQTIKTAKPSAKSIVENVYRLIDSEMKAVETELAKQIDSDVQVVKYLGEYLRSSGGKRLRPALLILAFRAAGGERLSDSVVRLAAVMEMLHTATLVHDDIIDNAETRRNRESVNAIFGNQSAVLIGDWLYMTAFDVSLRERSLEILDILIKLTRKMTEGELIQLTILGKSDISEEVYFDVLKRKTAYLFSTCCEIGAMLGDASAEERQALKDYGENLGVAFQLADDLLDFTADASVIGKASGADLLEGKVTLPLILLADEEPEIARELEKIMSEGSYENGGREKILNKLSSNGVLAETRKIAHNFTAVARKNLEVLPKTEYRLALEDIPTYMVERSK